VQSLVICSSGTGSVSSLACLSALKNLNRLSLSGCAYSISNFHLLHLTCLSDSLLDLDISGCASITDKGLEVLPKLGRLTSLDMSRLARVSDEGLGSVAHIPKLQRLNLSHNYQVGDDGLCLLGCFSDTLRELDLSSCIAVTDEGLAWLAESMRSLTSLRLTDLRGVTATGLLRAVSGFAELESLDLSRSPIQAAGMRQIAAACTSLSSLNLSGCRHIWGYGLCLTELQGLRSLRLAHCLQLRGADVVNVAKLASLRELDLSFCEGIGSNAFGLLASLTRLEGLSVSRCAGWDDAACWEVCRGLPQLTWLDVSGCRGLSDESVLSICHCPALRQLNASSTLISDQALSAVPLATSLEDLSLGSCRRLTDHGLRAIGEAKPLTRVDLSCLKGITASGLLALSPLTGLRTLDLRWCRNMSPEGVQEFTIQCKSTKVQIIREVALVEDIIESMASRMARGGSRQRSTRGQHGVHGTPGRVSDRRRTARHAASGRGAPSNESARSRFDGSRNPEQVPLGHAPRGRPTQRRGGRR